MIPTGLRPSITGNYSAELKTLEENLQAEIELHQLAIQNIYDKYTFYRSPHRFKKQAEVDRLKKRKEDCERKRDQFIVAAFELAGNYHPEQYTIVRPIINDSTHIGQIIQPIGLTKGNEIVKVGWLDKMSKSNKLSKRYVVVRPGFLSWFFSKPEDLLELMDNQYIPLTTNFECRAELFSTSTTKFFFHCILNDEVTSEPITDIIFNASSQEERRRWIDAINRSTKKVELKYRNDVQFVENIRAKLKDDNLTLQQYLDIIHTIPHKLVLPLSWIYDSKSDPSSQEFEDDQLFKDLERDCIEINGIKYQRDMDMANYEIVHIMIANLVTSLVQNCNTHVDPIEMVMFARHILSRTYRTQCGEDMMIPIYHLTNKSNFMFLSVSGATQVPLQYTITSSKPQSSEVLEFKGPYVYMTTGLSYSIVNLENPVECWLKMEARFVFSAEFQSGKEEGHVEITTTIVK